MPVIKLLCRCFAILLTLALLLTLAACIPMPVVPEPPAPAVEETSTPQELSPQTPPLPPELFPGKIAIISSGALCFYEEWYAAISIQKRYGEDKIILKPAPELFTEYDKIFDIAAEIAEDPDIKAVVMNQYFYGTLSVTDKLLETRDDIFIVICNPVEDIPDLAERANLILAVDEIQMGPAMARQAQKLGAETFVHLSFPRHMSYPQISKRHELTRQTCEELGLEFVDHTIPDPTGDIGMVGAQQVVREEIPELVAQYGKDTAFFCTNCGLQVPLIRAVVDAGAIYPQPCCPSPFHGFPLALGLASEGENIFYAAGTQDATKYIMDQITTKLAEKNMLGRVSTWPVTAHTMPLFAATEYAIKWINGEAPKDGIDVAMLEQCMTGYAGVECYARTSDENETYGDEAVGEFDNWFFFREDYITF